MTDDRRERVATALEGCARFMNELEELGVPVTLKWDAVSTDFGYVLRGPDDKWAPRLKLGEAPPVLVPDDLDG